MSGVVLDSSAVVSIVLGEVGWETLMDTLVDSSERLLSSASLTESGIVVERRSSAFGLEAVERLIRDANVTVVPVDRMDAEQAIAAWRRYGKGRHPASLTYGDCFVYALSERSGHPILCTGNDFAQTDLEVLPPR